MTKKKVPPVEAGPDPILGKLEAQILGAMTKLSPPVSARQMCESLGREGYFAYQAVLNAMNRLVSKSLLARSRRGRAYLYEPRVDVVELMARRWKNYLTDIDLPLDSVVCQAVRLDRGLEDGDLEQLRKQVAAIGRKKEAR